MKITIGEKGLKYSQQDDFEKETKCVYCDGIARIGFVVHEGIADDGDGDLLCDLYQGKDGLWLHDYCSVAVYFCKKCLKTTAIFNQG